eukprot:5142406-Amphidinium_carterae.1
MELFALMCLSIYMTCEQRLQKWREFYDRVSYAQMHEHVMRFDSNACQGNDFKMDMCKVAFSLLTPSIVPPTHDCCPLT